MAIDSPEGAATSPIGVGTLLVVRNANHAPTLATQASKANRPATSGALLVREACLASGVYDIGNDGTAEGSVAMPVHRWREIGRRFLPQTHRAIS